jgi:hypothetical protein
MNSARLVSPFQLLWFCASETMSVETLSVIQSDLKSRKDTLLDSSERVILNSAIAELDGLIVSRLAQRLASGPDARA